MFRNLTLLAIKCLKFIFLLPRKKDNIVRTMKQIHTKHFYFSLFNPLKMTGELEFRMSLWGRTPGELDGGDGIIHYALAYSTPPIFSQFWTVR